jgi:hypothetical protein
VKIDKGMLISSDTCWYVVVEFGVAKDGKLAMNCICDHANNIYQWNLPEIHSYMTLKEVGALGWRKPEREIHEHVRGREIPYDVIVEVLSGKHDDRFEHWNSWGEE